MNHRFLAILTSLLIIAALFSTPTQALVPEEEHPDEWGDDSKGEEDGGKNPECP